MSCEALSVMGLRMSYDTTMRSCDRHVFKLVCSYICMCNITILGVSVNPIAIL